MATPELSVVVVPIVGGRALETLLEGLAAEARADRAEILVVGGASVDSADWGDAVRRLPASPGATVPARRALGVSVSRGGVVALLEDTVRPDPGWCAAVSRLHARHPGVAAIGGSLRLSDGLPPRAVALSLLDFCHSLRGGPVSEPTAAVAGCDMSFKRAVLASPGALADGLFESELVPALADRGRGARLESGMGATVVAADPRGASWGSRFAHGRLHAGRRRRGESWRRRLTRLLVTPGVPLVLTSRALAAGRRLQRPVAPATLARVLILAIAWSAGELAGLLLGPGRSEEAWR